ncbi:MAG: DUF4112 domain-containing protein [Pseudomonadota bacterium]
MTDGSTEVHSTNKPLRYESEDLLTDDVLPHAAARRRVEALSRFLDSRFELPVIKYRFGFDSLIGLIPGVGDVFTASMALYLIYEAARAGAGPGLVARMVFNVAADTIIGAVPIFGDLFDFAFKANLMNANLLRRHYAELDDASRKEAVFKGKSLR